MNILWFIDKELDLSFSTSARIAGVKYLEKKHSVSLISGYKDREKDFEIKGCIYFLKKINLPFLKTASFYRQQLKFIDNYERLNGVDIILLNSSNLFLFRKLLKLKKRYGFKVILDVRTLPVDSNPLKRWINDFFLRKSLHLAARNFEGITYITEEMKKFCLSNYNLPEHSFQIWGSGVDPQIFKPSISHLSSREYRLMYHGQVARNRGLQGVIQALNILGDEEICFHILGAGEGLVEMKKLTKKLGLEGRVLFHSPVSLSEVPYYINSIHAGILPFPHWRGWNTSSPLKLFEYLACGKPVIATDIPAHSNVLKGKDFVFWISGSSPERIASAIREAKERKTEYRRLAEEARKFVEMNFTWERQVKKLEEFLEGL